MRKTEDVLIVVLCGGQSAHASLLQLASECGAFSAMENHRFRLALQPVTASPQELARNTACAIALERLEKPEDTLVMIDNDMVQRGWRSMRILETPDYDIAGGLQYMWLPRDHETDRPPQARPCAFMRQDTGVGQTCVYPAPGETHREVDRVGSGFMAIKRRVLADPRMHIAPNMDPPALWRNVFQPNYVRERGLDMDFCDRAKGLGYRIIVNWRAEIGHWKHVDVNEVDEYAKAQFIHGHEMGVENALSMASGRSGSPQGALGESRREQPDDGGVDQAGLARAAEPPDERAGFLRFLRGSGNRRAGGAPADEAARTIAGRE